MSTPENKLITVNGPVVKYSRSGEVQSQIVYSISLSNGMVITSPDRFAGIDSANEEKPASEDAK